MKKWQSLLSFAVLLGSMVISNTSLALTPGYYVREQAGKETGHIVVLNHEGQRYIGKKHQKDTLQLISITNLTNNKANYSLNATFIDIDEAHAITDKALIYYGNEYDSFNGAKVDNVARLYVDEEKLVLDIEEKAAGILNITSDAIEAEGYLGTYKKVNTFYQASRPLVVLALEAEEMVLPGENRTYIITEGPGNIDNGYLIKVQDNDMPIASLTARLDLSKIATLASKNNLVFISDYARQYDKEQAKKAKKAKG